MSEVPTPCRFSPNVDMGRRIANFYLDEPLAAASDLLELGPGQGLFMRAAHERGRRILGVDADRGAVTLCERDDLEVVHAHAHEYLASCNRTFDAVVALHLVEHFEVHQVTSLFELARTVCRPGGKLLLSTPNFADLDVSGEVFWLDPTTCGRTR
jgi:cyclopropane fatty-acyl-phospholipid synthase-like methyltransferase